jgi:hypothetical protein
VQSSGTAAAAPSVDAAGPSAAEEELGPLPLCVNAFRAGGALVTGPILLVLCRYWEERYTQSGRKFFVNHRTRITQWEDPRTGLRSDEPAVEVSAPCSQQGSEKPAELEQRCRASLQAVPYSRDFNQKKAQFRRVLLSTQPSGQFDLPVRRAHILEDSFRIISAANPSMLHKRMNVQFEGWPRYSRGPDDFALHWPLTDHFDRLIPAAAANYAGEKGLDYGGPAREWFLLLSQARPPKSSLSHSRWEPPFPPPILSLRSSCSPLRGLAGWRLAGSFQPVLRPL